MKLLLKIMISSDEYRINQLYINGKHFSYLIDNKKLLQGLYNIEKSYSNIFESETIYLTNPNNNDRFLFWNNNDYKNYLIVGSIIENNNLNNTIEMYNKLFNIISTEINKGTKIILELKK